MYEGLRDGALDYTGGAAHAPLYAFKDWAGCKLLAALSQNMYWFLVMRRDLGIARNDLAATRGLRIGAAPGPVDGLKQMYVDIGMDPARDVQLAPVPGTVGTGASFGVAAAKALEAGLIDGFWANGMGMEVAVRGGYGAVVVDARRDGPEAAKHYTFSVLATTSKRLVERPQEVAAAVRALVKAQRALRADPSIATGAAQRLFPALETSLIAELIARDAPFYDPAITPELVASVNAFSRKTGLLSDAVGYDAIVPSGVRRLWT
jgi:NitT/TauT family transport system substrate-binding protein